MIPDFRPQTIFELAGQPVVSEYGCLVVRLIEGSWDVVWRPAAGGVHRFERLDCLSACGLANALLAGRAIGSR